MKIPARNKIKIRFNDFHEFVFKKSRQRIPDAQKETAMYIDNALAKTNIDTVVFAGEKARGIAKRLPSDFYRTIPVTKAKEIDVNERVAIIADKALIQKTYATVIMEFPLKTSVIEFYDASDNQLFL